MIWLALAVVAGYGLSIVTWPRLRLWWRGHAEEIYRLRQRARDLEKTLRSLAGLVLLAVLAVMLVAAPALAFARGDDGHADPAVRAWFRSVTSPAGVPCCDIADGHRTTWRTHGAVYQVPIEGTWHDVPPEAVVHPRTNPVGGAIVWYVRYGGTVVIRCFVAGGGV